MRVEPDAEGMIMENNIVLYAIRASWDNETAYPMPESNLLSGDSSTGQCAITAALIQEYFGGEIRKGLVNGTIKHYWNILDGEKLDITAEQFYLPINITEEKRVDRDILLADESFYLRYSLLKARVEAFIGQYQEIEKKIECCYKCEGMVEHFVGSTIFFGRRNDILLLGEAPAPNGWRKSGLVWRDVDGKLIPSGKRLQDLLALCGISLFDCSFIEVVKCYPTTRKSLEHSARHCGSFLEEQITLLSPKLILPLGKVATQTVLSTSCSFDTLVGRPQKLQLGGHKIAVFPLYHPSPISPKSWKNNAPLMVELENLFGAG